MVDEFGLTAMQALAFRLLPTPGAMVIEVAPLICQHNWLEPPGLMIAGLATNCRTCGTVPAVTVTVTGAVTLLPSALVAVKV